MLELVFTFSIQPDRRIMNLAEQRRITGIRGGDEIRAALRHALLLAREIEVLAPVRDRATDRRANALHLLQLRRACGKDRARITAEFSEQTIERDRTDVRQRVQNQHRLPFGQLAAHAYNWRKDGAR